MEILETNPPLFHTRAEHWDPIPPKEPNTPKLFPKRYKLLSGSDIVNEPLKEWAVKGIFPIQGISAVYGPSGSGKSFLCIELAAAIQEGKPFFDLKTKQTDVIIIGLEGESGYKVRYDAWKTINVRDIPFKTVLRQSFNVTIDKDVADLAEAVPKGCVVIIDTMNQSAPTIDENASKDMGSVIRGLKQLQTLTKGLVIIVHHTGKNETRGLRGHSSLHAAMDAEIEVQGDPESPKKSFKTTKVKDGAAGKSFPFELIPIDLGEDEDGEPITSCYVKPTPSFELRKTTTGTLGENQKIAMEVIDELLKANGDLAEGEDGWQLIYAEVREDIADRLTQVEKKRRSSRSKEALTGLINNGYYRHEGDFLLPGLTDRSQLSRGDRSVGQNGGEDLPVF
jgi:archaellum biogenesis ATPase FlaH